MHPCRFGRSDRDQHRTSIFGLKLQLLPMRNDPGAKIKLGGEPLGCCQGVVGRLAIDMQYSGEGEDEIGSFLQTHYRSNTAH